MPVFLSLSAFCECICGCECVRGQMECFSACINRLCSPHSLLVKPAGLAQSSHFVSPSKGSQCLLYIQLKEQQPNLWEHVCLSALCELLLSVTESCHWANASQNVSNYVCSVCCIKDPNSHFSKHRMVQKFKVLYSMAVSLFRETKRSLLCGFSSSNISVALPHR